MMTTKQQELLDLKRRQEELEIEIKIEEENRKQDKMTNEELLKVADKLLDSCYKKQRVYINAEICTEIHSQIMNFKQTFPWQLLIRRDRKKSENYSRIIKKIGVNGGCYDICELISICNIINNDELTENVKKEIEKNLSDEYKLMQLLIHIVKKQEEKLNNS